MTYKIGDHVRVKKFKGTCGVITGYYTGTRSLGYHRINLPKENTSGWPVTYGVKYDMSATDADAERVSAECYRCGIYTEDDLESVEHG